MPPREGGSAGSLLTLNLAVLGAMFGTVAGLCLSAPHYGEILGALAGAGLGFAMARHPLAAE